MICPARNACSPALSMASRSMRGPVVGAVLEQPPRALHVVRDRGQRLVQLVRQRRGHLAHGGQPGDMHELGLQFLQPRLGLLALGQVADEAGEEALIARAHLADRKLHRKGRAVPALADDDPADADDSPLSGAEISLEVAVVILAVGRRHQHLDVFSHDLRRRVAEQPLGRRAERLHDPALVDDDHRVRNGVEDRPQCASRASASRVLAAARMRFRCSCSPLQAMPAPNSANAAALTISAAETLGSGCDDKEAEQRAERGREQSGPQSADARGNQDRRHEEQIGRLVLQDRRQRMRPAKASATARGAMP